MGRRCPRARHVWLGLVALVLLLGPLAAGAVDAAAKPPGPSTGAGCLRADGTTGSAEVVLDPGHGGGDTGAVNATYALVEKELTLQVAARAAEILGTSRVALTRYGDQGLGNSERGEIANACGAAVFVSIHFNAASDPAVNYTKTFWGKRRKDEAFSWVMHDALVGQLGIADGGVGQFATGSLLQAEMPSTLAETVFLSSDAEAQRIATDDGARLEQIAQAIARGVANGL